MTTISSTGTDRAHTGLSAAARAVVPATGHFTHRIFAAGLDRARAGIRRFAERRVLACLSDHYLRDVGLSAADVAEERSRLGLGQSIESIRHRAHL